MERKKGCRIWVRILFPAFLVSTCYLLPTSSLSQIIFEKTYGGSENDEGYSVQETMDGGFILAGYTKSSGAGEGDVYLIKTDSMGGTLWTKTYGGPDLDIGWSVYQNSDKGYILTGETWSSGTDSNDVYMIRTDSLGNIICEKTLGGFMDRDMGFSVQQTSDGGFIFGGATVYQSAGLEDVYLIRTDILCDTLWTKTYGGTNTDQGYSVQETQDGGFIVAGYTASFGAGSLDVYLIKTDFLGDLRWSRTYGGSLEDQGQYVQQTLDEGYIIVGFTESFGEGSYDVYLIKTDSLGDTLWTKTHGGPLDDRGYSVDQTSDGGYILMGYTESFGAGNKDVWLIKTDSLGDTIWTCTFGGTEDDCGYSVEETSDGFYIFTGYTASFGEGNRDVYLIKADSCGVVGVEENKENNEYRMSNFDFRLFQSQPNPFHSTTYIRYIIPWIGDQESGDNEKYLFPVKLSIYDLTGKQVEILIEEHQVPGIYHVKWEGKDQPNGIYFYRLSTRIGQGYDLIQTQKMILLR
jgi:hypothetical protein